MGKEEKDGKRMGLWERQKKERVRRQRIKDSCRKSMKKVRREDGDKSSERGRKVKRQDL